MPEIDSVPYGTRAAAFFSGLLWAIGHSLGPVATLLIFDLTKYKDYGIDWEPLWVLALVSGAQGAYAYVREHFALLAPSPNTRALIEAAEQRGEVRGAALATGTIAIQEAVKSAVEKSTVEKTEGVQ